jgi:hypothetical protein
VKVSLSVIFDRAGEFVELQTNVAAAPPEEEKGALAESFEAITDSLESRGQAEVPAGKSPMVDHQKDPKANKE